MNTRLTPTKRPSAARAFAGGRRAARARGLGLIEMMLALAISAAVLTAVATAIDISFKSYAANQENASLMQRARMAMHRITTDIRTTALHQPEKFTPAYDDFITGKIVTTDTVYLYLDLNDVTSDVIRYSYDPMNKVVMCINAAADEFVVCRGVEAFSVKMEPMRSEKSIRTGGSYDLLMRATITLTVKSDANAAGADVVTLSTSVMPRRNVW